MLVTLDELMNSMGRPNLETYQEQHVEQVLLPAVQRELEDYCKRPLELKQVRERLIPDCEGWVFFGFTPVWEVISVQDVNGNPVTGWTPPAIPPYVPSTNPDIADIDLVGTGWVDEPYRAWMLPMLPLVSSSSDLYYGLPISYYWTYIAGFDCTNDKKVKNAILIVAERSTDALFGRSVGIRQGAVELSPQRDNRPPMWTKEELAEFDRYRRRVVVC